MATTHEEGQAIRAQILTAFGPPSKGKQLTRANIQQITGIPGQQVIHHMYMLQEAGQIRVVGKQAKPEGKRGRAADLYGRVAGNGGTA